MAPIGPERIVVGVDGSSASQAALEWAAHEAHVRGARLDVIHAFRVPFEGGGALAPLMIEHDEYRAGAQRMLDRAVAHLDQCCGAVALTSLVVAGPAAPVLCEAGRGAAMIVVGTRGADGIAGGVLLGSVSRMVSEHATVPVVVVPSRG